jgi:mono/diheme cytochrome c family protein/glucose/arabinose dehydrogenase
MPAPLRLSAFIVAAAIATGHGFQAPAPSSNQWPPPLQPMRADSSPLSPAEEMKTFFMPPGYRVELVASEPLVQDPILIDWDPDGRLWVVEMPGYMHDMRASDEHDPTGRIVVLEDADDDGKMDKRTVFADGLVLPRALKVLDQGVLVGEPPNVWLMRDTDGDLKADTKESVTDQYGRREAQVEHNANSFLWALDNWMYTSEVNMFLRMRRGKVEVRRTLSRGQWGASQDDAGRIFRNTNSSVLHVDLVPTQYYARHPSLLRTRGSYEPLLGDNGETNIVWPVHPTPGVNRGYQAGVLRADKSLATYTAVGSPVVYRGDRLPQDVYGNVFVAESAGNVVSRIIVEDDGTGLFTRKAYPKGEFLASTDERFRPVYLSNAPDGTLYIVDMYRGIIQHRDYVTEYLRDHFIARKLEQPTSLGRIFRVMHDTTRRAPRMNLSKAPLAEVVAALSHPSGWWRDTAQRVLVERGDASVVPALAALAQNAPEARTRLHALWTLDGLDSVTSEMVLRALDDRSRDVRASAVRLAERVLVEANPPVQQALIRRIDDQDWAVRYQLAASLGELSEAVRVPALALLLARRGDEPIVVDAAISSAVGKETAVLERLFTLPAPPTIVEGAAAMLAATVTRGGQADGTRQLFEWANEDARPEWQRSALLRGVEIALLNARMPGTPEPAAAAGRAAAAAPAPCPTCPGGRAGPGGAPAFPAGGRAAAPTTSPAPAAGRAGAGAGRAGGAAGRAGAGGGRGNSGPILRVESEPQPLVALAAKGGDLGRRATALLARVEWPGKPGATAEAAPPPLTPAQQQLLAAGEEVYKNLCQACHQENGRGQERLGANLVGAAYVTGSAAIAARILLNGKEGPIGLMPPLGTGLNDDQIAGSLTYIRRQWGNTAAPVDPSLVKDVRAQTATRTKPWTDAELAALPR